VVWRLGRLGRNLRHLSLLLDELHALGVAFVSRMPVKVANRVD
jgi:DNA invertase Pin-like site-specific DNA recombinase